MSTVRAKFLCIGVEDQHQYEQKAVSLMAVTSGSEENKSFAKYTPSGNLQITVSYDTPASDYFESGKEYFLDFSEAK